MDFLFILIPIFLGWVNAYFAQTRGRNPFTWFILGFFFGIISLIVLFILPSYNDKKDEKKESAESDDGIYVSRHAPFDQHDWYYLDKEHKQKGPHTFRELKRYFGKENISLETYVWNETMSDWKKIKDMPDFLTSLKD